MRPTTEQIIAAVEEFGMLRYFPSDEAVRKGVMRLLARMVATQEQLAWLVRTMVNEVGEWQGPVELRGVFCTRYAPADGVEAEASGKFAPAALEAVEQKRLGVVPRALLPVLEEIRPVVVSETEAQMLEVFERIRARGVPKRRERTAEQVDEMLRAAGCDR